MNSFELTKLLIEKVDEYQNSKEDKTSLTVEEFKEFIKATQNIDALRNTFIPPTNTTHESYHKISVDRIISQQILFLYRYVKHYSKYVFQNSSIKSIEEFSILITVLQHTSVTKSELIKKNVLEKTTGIEIINRLIKQGYLIQSNNPNDQRSQIIQLTESGKIQIYQSFDGMNDLSNISTGKLTEEEKYKLATILKKLDDFHYINHNKPKANSIKDFLSK